MSKASNDVTYGRQSGRVGQGTASEGLAAIRRALARETSWRCPACGDRFYRATGKPGVEPTSCGRLRCRTQLGPDAQPLKPEKGR